MTDQTWRVLRQPDRGVGLHAGRIVRRPAGERRLGPARAGRRRVAGRHACATSRRVALDGQVMEPVRVTGELQPKRIRQREAGLLDFRSRPEHGRRGAAEGRRPRRARSSRSGTPRCSIPTARSTRPTSAAPRRPTPTCAKGRRRGVAAAVHLPRFPLRGADRPARQSVRRYGDRHRDRLRHAADGRVRLFRSAAQPVAVEHPVGAAGQLPQRAHRLPAARRADGLDGRRPGIHPHGHVQRRRGGVLYQVAGRRGRRAVARGRFRRHLAGRADARLWPRHARLGRRRRDLPVDHLPGLWRPARCWSVTCRR